MQSSEAEVDVEPELVSPLDDDDELSSSADVELLVSASVVVSTPPLESSE